MELLGISAGQWLGIIGFFSVFAGIIRTFSKLESTNDLQNDKLNQVHRLAQNALDKAEATDKELSLSNNRAEKHFSQIESNLQIVINEQMRQGEQYEKLLKTIEKESDKRSAESLKRDEYLQSIVSKMTRGGDRP